MDFDERLWALASKVGNQREAIQTEEATKNAFIMPFISTILGYDIFNPLEVVPEFSADVGVKKNEKVDYAIMRDGEVQILIECKKSTEPLKIETCLPAVSILLSHERANCSVDQWRGVQLLH